MAPVAEELEVPSLLVDGCTDALFEKEVTRPKNTFRITNLNSADAISGMIMAARAWPEVKRISHIHPDFAFGRFGFIHSKIAGEKLFGGSEVVSEGWPKLFETDFTPFITKALSAKPDLIVTSCWGPDYQAFYTQGLRYGLFDKAKVVANLALGTPPHLLDNDHPDGIVAGVHGNYHFTHPPGNQWPLNKQFVERYHKCGKEYPNFEAEGAYTGLYMLKAAIEKALSQVVWVLSNKLYWVTGGSDGIGIKWPSLLGMFHYSGGGAFHRFVNDYYYYVLVIFCVVVVAMWLVCHSPFGKALQAIRDNETRAGFLGIDIRRCRLIAFIVSGSVTGLAGTLWVPLTGHVTPDSLHWPFSGEILFLTLLGGFGNFTGPIVGGIVYNYLKVYAVASTEYWQFVLGGALLLMVLTMPAGIVGLVPRIAARFRRKEEDRA